MKIMDFTHRTVAVPVTYPVVSCVRETKEIIFVILDVITDEGIRGISYAQAFHLHGAAAIRSCLDHLKAAVQGEDPFHIEKLWNKMWQSIKLLGRQGLPTFALSMVDIALWDILGKAMNQPIYRLLGGHRTSLGAYASDGLWLVEPSEAAAQAEHFAELGFTSMKMRLGRLNQHEDLKAIKKIRKALDDDIELMGDVNQGWSLDQAKEMGKKAEDLGLNWLEEPIDADDMEGYAELSNSLRLPIASGENLYTINPFHRYLNHKSSSVYTPDLQRIGGITGWKRLVALFEVYQVRFSVHLFPEMASHLLASCNKSEKLEWMSWGSHLFKEPLECTNGVIKVPDRPGFGMEWDQDKIEKFLL